MPIVPTFPASLWSRQFGFSTVTETLNTGTGKWTTSIASGTLKRNVMSAGVLRQKGKKVHASWGWWAPCRPYYRTATTMTLLPGEERYGNNSNEEAATFKRKCMGLPNRMPSTPVGDFVINPTTTEGLFSSGLPTLDSNTRSRLITECMAKVNGREANYGEAIGEGRKTLAHLAQTSSQVIRALLALRKGNFQAFRRALRVSGKGWKGNTLSSRWLEYQYAWLPLLGDIYDTSQILTNGMKTRPQVFSAIRATSTSGGYAHENSDMKLKGGCSVSHRCKLWYRVSNSSVDTLSRLGLINPFEVAWALMPFSFVIDWFIPVGTMLEAYSATLGLSFVDGCISSRGDISCEGQHKPSPQGAYPHVYAATFQWAGSHTGFQRTVVVSPKPSLFVKSPFSSTHVVSALALLHQLRR